MKSIASSFKIIFTTKEFTDLNILCFAEDHLQRLIHNNISGAYDLLIKSTNDFFYALYNLRKSQEIANEQKRTLTHEVQKMTEALKESIRKLEGLLRSQLAKESEIYARAFPEGLSEYCRLSRSNTQALMIRILIFLKENNEIVTPIITREINNLYNQYTEKRKEQLSVMKLLEEIISEKRVARKNLSYQLQKNVYTLAIECLGQPEKAKLFFDQKLLSSQNLKCIDDHRRKILKT